MKKEELKAIDLTDEQADKVFAMNGKDVEKYKQEAKSAAEEVTTLKTQLTEANKQIEKFQSMDIESVKKSAEEWKQKAEQAEKDAAEKIASMQFESLLDTAIGNAKGRNTKAIKALLPMDTLKDSKNQGEDIKNALKTIKEQNDYLFEPETPAPVFGKPTPGATGSGMDAVRAAAGLKPTETK